MASREVLDLNLANSNTEAMIYMDVKSVTAPCGMDCFNCPMFVLNITEEFKLKISGLAQCPPEEVPCSGCRLQGSCGVMMKDCKTLSCVNKKGLEFCSDCSSFPCEYLQPCASRADVIPHNMKLYNLCRIKTVGLEAWAKESPDIRKRYYSGSMVLGEGPVLKSTNQ
jgi:hypothetical protein